MSEREADLTAALASVLGDARYALAQLRPILDAGRAYHSTKVLDRAQRATDALERIQSEATAILEPAPQGAAE